MRAAVGVGFTVREVDFVASGVGRGVTVVLGVRDRLGVPLDDLVELVVGLGVPVPVRAGVPAAVCEVVDLGDCVGVRLHAFALPASPQDGTAVWEGVGVAEREAQGPPMKGFTQSCVPVAEGEGVPLGDA